MKPSSFYTKEVMKHFKKPRNMGVIKNPDGLGKVGNVVCLLPDTKIQINDNLDSIKNIKINSRVLSHDGKYHRVLKKFKRKYKGNVIKIKNRFGINYLTPRHELLSIKVPKTHHFLYLRNKVKLKPAWHHANELERRDIVLYPILKETIDVKTILTKMKKLKFDYNSKLIPKNIPVNDEFLRLSGYFIAEGYLKEKITKTFVSFTFGIKEEKYVDDVIKITKDIFGLEAKKRIVKEHNSIIVTINNVFVTRLFKNLFGNGAENKHLPHFMMLLPPEKQKSIILGLWRGDGYINVKRKYKRASYSTISYKLVQQIKTLLLRQGIIPSIYTEEEKIVKGVKHKKTYRIHIGNRSSLKKLADILGVQLNTKLESRNDSWCDEDYVYIPLTGVSKHLCNSFVFNLKVEKSGTYVSDSLTLHNCGDVMWIYIKVGKNKNGDKIIKDISFQTFGCIVAIAVSSKITVMAKGKTLEEALKINRKDIVKSLGGLPVPKIHCSLLAIDALAEAIYDFYKKNKIPIPDSLSKRHDRIKKVLKSVEERYEHINLEKKI
jgi:nitrogen fixation NifU-like protein